jgi:hypothetical protein
MYGGKGKLPLAAGHLQIVCFKVGAGSSTVDDTHLIAIILSFDYSYGFYVH